MNQKKRYDAVLGLINENFPDLGNQNETVLKRLLEILENNPQKLINFLRSYLKRNPITTTFVAKFKKLKALKKEDDISLIEKLEIISLLWELNGFLQFPASILSNNNIPLNADLHPNVVFKYFQSFGLSGSNKELFRQLRDAASHKLDIRGEHLFDEKGKSFAHISDVDVVLSKAMLIYYWWLSVFVQTALYHPKLASIVIISITVESRKENSEMNTYISELKTNFSDFFALFERQNKGEEFGEKNWFYCFIEKGKGVYEKMKSAIFKIIFPLHYAVGIGLVNAIGEGIGDIIRQGFDWFEIVLKEGEQVSKQIEESDYKEEFIDSLDFIKGKLLTIKENLKSNN